jgi:V8-like Glu-specific endopeptidase
MRARKVTSAAIAVIALLIPLAVAGSTLARGSSASAIGRQSRLSGISIAGGNVYVWSSHRPEESGGGCTIAFAVRSRRTHAIGALTAGHCVRTIPGGPSYQVHQTQRMGRTGTAPGDLLGTVGRHAARLGANGDSAFVRLAANRIARPRVFIGPIYTSTTIPVVGQLKVRDGLSVCYSGAATGEHCGYRVVGRPETVVFQDGKRVFHIKHEWRATSTTCTSRRGDSGSPVYVRRNGKALAVGLLSGGQEVAGRCPFFFTPVTTALRTLHLKLLTN